MKVTLVQPPSHRVDTSELAPPLGVLTVATVLREDGVDVSIVDLNLECLRTLAHAGAAFYDWATERIAATAPDLVGFTSMALETHIGLEISRRLKRRDPAVRIVMGGAHVTAIAEDILTHYPWIDFVVAGEGETAARGLVRALRGGRRLGAVANLAFMDAGGFRLDRVLRPNRSFDDYPFPAYDLVDLDAYFALNPYRVLDIEQNRGCVLRCAYCYAAGHWGQGEQARSVERVVADVQRHYDLGGRHLSFVGDNFLNDKAYATAVADAIAAANPGVTWRCYGTLPQLTEDVVEAFARAGCRYVFVGVDAVSAGSKRRFKKSYFRGWPMLRRSLERCLDRAITPTCAFLLQPGVSAATNAENEEVLTVAAHVQLLRCGVRLNPLTVYARTGLAPTLAKHPIAPSNEKPRVLFDGHWMTEQNPFAEARPGLFPYHSTLGPPERFAAFIRATHAGHTLLDHFSRTLMQAIHAGLPLWPLLHEAAARVDYAGTDKAAWRDGEVRAFLERVGTRRTTREMRDTLAFEAAEYGLRHHPTRAPVRLDVDGATLAAWLLPHARVRLSRSPLAYEGTDPVAAGEGWPGERMGAEPMGEPAKQTFLVLPNGPGMRYLRPRAAADRLIRDLGDAAASGRTVTAPAAGIAKLIAAEVIALPAPALRKPGEASP